MANSGKPAMHEAGSDPDQKHRQTPGSREESMKESDRDQSGKQSPARSGTTPLAGDSSTSNDEPGPGGVEGTGETT
jgi:hypothetical protein